MSRGILDRAHRLLGRNRDSTLLRNGPRYLRHALEAAREVEITPFLMWGTLLGCVRNGGLLQHDGDLDLGIRSGDYMKRHAWTEAMRRRGYRLAFDKAYKFRFAHPLHSLHIDVDVFYPWQDKLICAATDDHDRMVAEFFDADCFDQLQEVDFIGLRAFVPQPAERVLAAVYGNWREPRPDYDSGNGPLNRLALPPDAPAPPLQPGLRPGF